MGDFIKLNDYFLLYVQKYDEYSMLTNSLEYYCVIDSEPLNCHSFVQHGAVVCVRSNCC